MFFSCRFFELYMRHRVLHVSRLYAGSFSYTGVHTVYLSRTIFILFWFICIYVNNDFN